MNELSLTVHSTATCILVYAPASGPQIMALGLELATAITSLAFT